MKKKAKKNNNSAIAAAIAGVMGVGAVATAGAIYGFKKKSSKTEDTMADLTASDDTEEAVEE